MRLLIKANGHGTAGMAMPDFPDSYICPFFILKAFVLCMLTTIAAQLMLMAAHYVHMLTSRRTQN